MVYYPRPGAYDFGLFSSVTRIRTLFFLYDMITVCTEETALVGHVKLEFRSRRSVVSMVTIFLYTSRHSSRL